MSSLAPFLWRSVVKSLHLQHTLAFHVLWQHQHFPLTVERVKHDSPGGEDFWFAHCFSEHEFAYHTLKSSSAVLVAGQNIVFYIFFSSISFMQNFIKAPIYCETKFDTEYAPAQQEKNCSSI